MKYQILVAFFLLLFGCTQEDKEKQKANIFFNNAIYDSSAFYYQRIVASNPSDTISLYRLILSLKKIQDFKEAIRLSKSELFDKAWKDSILLLCYHIYNEQESDSSILMAEELAKRHPYNKEYHLNLANSYYNKAINNLNVKDEFLSKGFSEIKTALSIDSNYYDAIHERALLRYGFGDFSGVINDMELVISKNIKDSSKISSCYRFIGLSLANRNDYKAAILKLDTALIFDPTNSYNYLSRGQIYLLNSENMKACEDFSKSLELGNIPAGKEISINCN
ncbi:MAG: hypothetical protein AABY93_05370 [Bacteroidota bacterium]